MPVIIDYAFNLPISSNEMIDFYDKNWNRKIALSIKDFFEWQFIKPIDNLGKNYCIVAYDTDNSSIAGIMGLNCRKFLLENKKLNAAELTTWIVADQYLGAGVGGKIIKKIQSDFDAAFGMGISSQALPLYMKSGFRYLKAIPRFLRVFNYEKIVKFAEAGVLAPKLTRFFLNKKKNNTPYTVQPNIPFLSKIDSYHFIRTVEHLEWRYKQHPVFKYHTFSISSQIGSLALVVIRIEDSIDDLRVAHIIDFFAEDDDAYRASLSFLDDYARDNYIDIMDFYCTSSSVNKFFLANGWFSILDDECLQFPHLFHPVELRTPATTSLTYWTKNQNDFESLCDFSKLYITKQDMDFDRPTAQTYFNLKNGK